MTSRLDAFVRARFDPAQRYGLRATLFGLAIALAGIPFGLLLDQVMRKGPLVAIDTSAARHLHTWISDKAAFITALKIVTFFGTPQWFFLMVGAVSIFLLRRHRYRLMTFLLVTSIGGGLIDSIIKILVDRDRPNLENPLIPLHGKSFPSGHAMSSTFVYGALLLVFMPAFAKQRRALIVAVVTGLVLAIGVSRLFLGVHYITDVAGGYVLGAAWLAASTAAFSIWRTDRGRKPVDPKRGVEPEAGKDLHVAR